MDNIFDIPKTPPIVRPPDHEEEFDWPENGGRPAPDRHQPGTYLARREAEGRQKYFDARRKSEERMNLEP